MLSARPAGPVSAGGASALPRGMDAPRHEGPKTPLLLESRGIGGLEPPMLNETEELASKPRPELAMLMLGLGPGLDLGTEVAPGRIGMLGLVAEFRLGVIATLEAE